MCAAKLAIWTSTTRRAPAAKRYWQRSRVRGTTSLFLHDDFLCIEWSKWSGKENVDACKKGDKQKKWIKLNSEMKGAAGTSKIRLPIKHPVRSKRRSRQVIQVDSHKRRFRPSMAQVAAIFHRKKQVELKGSFRGTCTDAGTLRYELKIRYWVVQNQSMVSFHSESVVPSVNRLPKIEMWHRMLWQCDSVPLVHRLSNVHIR